MFCEGTKKIGELELELELEEQLQVSLWDPKLFRCIIIQYRILLLSRQKGEKFSMLVTS